MDTLQFARELLSSTYPLLILAAVLIFNNRIYLIVRGIFRMTKRQLSKQKLTNRLIRSAKQIERRIMHSYLIEVEGESDNLHYWQP
jgi:hypothetical protein